MGSNRDTEQGIRSGVGAAANDRIMALVERMSDLQGEEWKNKGERLVKLINEMIETGRQHAIVKTIEKLADKGQVDEAELVQVLADGASQVEKISIERRRDDGVVEEVEGESILYAIPVVIISDGETPIPNALPDTDVANGRWSRPRRVFMIVGCWAANPGCCYRRGYTSQRIFQRTGRIGAS